MPSHKHIRNRMRIDGIRIYLRISKAQRPPKFPRHFSVSFFLGKQSTKPSFFHTNTARVSSIQKTLGRSTRQRERPANFSARSRNCIILIYIQRTHISSPTPVSLSRENTAVKSSVSLSGGLIWVYIHRCLRCFGLSSRTGAVLGKEREREKT